MLTRTTNTPMPATTGMGMGMVTRTVMDTATITAAMKKTPRASV